VLAQDQSASLEILDLNTGRYDEDGRVTVVVEFRNITGLNTDELVVTENGEPVETIEVESIAESTVKVGVVLLIDVSGSMENGDAIGQAKAAAANFVRNKRDQDWIALVTFGDQVTVLSAFRNEPAELLRLINTLEANGDTALYDGLIRSVGMYGGEAAELQPHIIILTDGKDEGSLATQEEALATLTSPTAPRVFGIGLETAAFDPAPLRSFASATGGLYLATSDPEELDTLYDQIQRELDNKLVLRFNAKTKNPEDVEFGVEYGALTASTTVAVPGYVTRSTAPRTTTTVTFPQAAQYTVTSSSPAPPGTLLIIGSVAVGISLVMLLYILFGREKDEGADSFRSRLQAYGRAGEAKEEKRGILARIPLLGRFTESAEEAARQRGILGALNNVLEQGNVPLRAGEAMAAGLGLSVVIGVIAWAITRNVIAGAVALGVMLLISFVILQQVGEREKKKFESQLPDTLILLSTSLRAGLSLLQAVEAVVSEAPQPTGREFGRVIAETRLGRPVVEALHGITERMRSDDWHWAVMAIEIQREVGGNLAEVLQTVADTMLQRNRLRGEIRALTAEGRISAIILAALPFLLALFLFTTSPDYVEPLFADTRGWAALGVGLLLMILGGFWLKKVVDIEI
jgi:tight adherence protein B